MLHNQTWEVKEVIHSEPRTTGDDVQGKNLVGTWLLIHIFVLNWDDKQSW